MLRLIVSGLVLFFALAPLPAEANIKIPFKGEFDIVSHTYQLQFQLPEDGRITLDVKKKTDKEFEATANIEHLSTRIFDISTILQSSVAVSYDKDGKFRSLSGKIGSRYTLINFKPEQEVSGMFEVKNGYFYVNSLTLGKSVILGKTKLSSPYVSEYKVRLADMYLFDFLSLFIDPAELKAEGLVSGDIAIAGTPQRLELKGRFSSFDGNVHNFPFENIFGYFEGVYPVINVFDTVVAQPDGLSFKTTGMLDLSKGQFAKQFTSFTKEPLVRSSGSDREWTLKQIRTGEDAGVTEFKYLMREGGKDSLPLNEDMDMIGVERKMHF